ncbi:recombinase family protein [Microbacterium sp. 22195]|uniref:recombinase family protein n=1 Tax=Microbacterium sp. 22195 TaxID=3453891 RepID=UPI003F8473C8
MNTSTVKAAVYLRISLDKDGDGLAVDRQRSDCMRILGERGWTLYEEYADESISAFKKNVARPAYDRMSADFKAGKFRAIVCWDLDRLTRQPRQLEDWIDAAEDSGLLLVTANGEADLTNDNGRMFARVKAAIARGEMERKSLRQKNKNAQNVALGRPVPGKRRYGFLSGNIKAHPEEAPKVVDLFARVLNGETIFGLAQEWNKAPVRIREILSNPAYAGWVTRKGERFEAADYVDRIVDREVWEAVQVLLADPSRKTSPGNQIRHLASGIARCGVCKARMVKMGPNYLCKGNLSHPTIKAAMLDEHLIGEAFTFLMSQPEQAEPEAVTALLADLAALHKRRQALQEQATWEGADLAYIRTEVARIGREVEKVQARVDAERLTVVAGDIVAKIRAEITRLAGDPSIEADEELYAVWLDLWAGLSLADQREVLGRLDIEVAPGRGLDRVTVTPR